MVGHKENHKKTEKRDFSIHASIACCHCVTHVSQRKSESPLPILVLERFFFFFVSLLDFDRWVFLCKGPKWFLPVCSVPFTITFNSPPIPFSRMEEGKDMQSHPTQSMDSQVWLDDTDSHPRKQDEKSASILCESPSLSIDWPFDWFLFRNREYTYDL